MTTTAVDEVRVVRIAGTPRERGRRHGEELRSLIVAGLERWEDNIGQSTGLAPRTYLERFVDETDFLPAIERWTPHLLEEVRGIAEGAGLPFRDVYAYQLMDEDWVFRSDLTAGRQAAEHCSTIGAFGESGTPAILAQNMDLPKYYDGSQALIQIAYPDSDLEALVCTPAGLIATCGLNNRGIGVCVNTLAQLRSSRRGLPVAFVARRAIEAEALDEAVGFIHDVPHASGQNYAVGAPGRIVDLECSAGKVAAVTQGATRVYHTNHPLANDDRPVRDAAAPSVFRTEAASQSDDDLPNTRRRLAYLEQAWGNPSTRASAEAARAVLSSCETPISVARESAGDGMTFSSLVMELSDRPVLHFAPGPPAETPYRLLSFQPAQ